MQPMLIDDTIITIHTYSMCVCVVSLISIIHFIAG